LLKQEQVGTLLFTESNEMPNEILVIETRLQIKTINQVVDELNNSSEGIYFALFD
jgi:hypothetical protein